MFWWACFTLFGRSPGRRPSKTGGAEGGGQPGLGHDHLRPLVAVSARGSNGGRRGDARKRERAGKGRAPLGQVVLRNGREQQKTCLDISPFDQVLPCSWWLLGAPTLRDMELELSDTFPPQALCPKPSPPNIHQGGGIQHLFGIHGHPNTFQGVGCRQNRHRCACYRHRPPKKEKPSRI